MVTANEIQRTIQAHDREANEMVKRLIDGEDPRRVVAAVTGLFVRVLTGSSTAGTLVEEGLQLSFENAADKLLREELATMLQEEREAEERAKVADTIAARLEGLIFDAVVQVQRSACSRVADIPADLAFRANSDASFRSELAAGLRRNLDRSDALARVPNGPRVDTDLVTSILRDHFALHHAGDARAVRVTDANALRRRLDDGARVLVLGELPTDGKPDHTFWYQALRDACLKGPRMIGALLVLEQQNAGEMTRAVRLEYDDLWTRLVEGRA